MVEYNNLLRKKNAYVNIFTTVFAFSRKTPVNKFEKHNLSNSKNTNNNNEIVSRNKFRKMTKNHEIDEFATNKYLSDIVKKSKELKYNEFERIEKKLTTKSDENEKEINPNDLYDKLNRETIKQIEATKALLKGEKEIQLEKAKLSKSIYARLKNKEKFPSSSKEYNLNEDIPIPYSLKETLDLKHNKQQKMKDLISVSDKSKTIEDKKSKSIYLRLEKKKSIGVNQKKLVEEKKELTEIRKTVEDEYALYNKEKLDFKDLVNKDTQSKLLEVRQEYANQEHQQKLDKIKGISKKESGDRFLDKKYEIKKQKFQISAMRLGKMLNLDNGKIKHYYYLMLKEDKEIEKIEDKFIKTEEKRKLKKLAKQWKINWENQFDSYDDLGNEEKNNIFSTAKKIDELPAGYLNYDELEFYDDNKDRMIYHKKMLNSIESSFAIIFSTNKTNFLKALADFNIQFSKFVLNKPCTDLSVYFILPQIEGINLDELFENCNLAKMGHIKESEIILPKSKTEEEKKKLQGIYDFVENELNKNASMISKQLSDIISFKKSLKVTFLKDKIYSNLEILIDSVKPLISTTDLSQNEEKTYFDKITLLKKENFFKSIYEAKLQNLIDENTPLEVRTKIKQAITFLKNYRGNFISFSKEVSSNETNEFLLKLAENCKEIEEELKNLPDKTAQLLLKKVYHNIEKNEPIEVTEENNPKMIALKNETKKKLGVEYEYLKRNRFSTKSPSDFYSIISNFLDNYKYKKSYVKSQSSSNLQPDFSNSFDNLEKSIIRESEYNKELEKLMYDHSYEAKDLKNKKKKKAMDFWLRLDKNN